MVDDDRAQSYTLEAIGASVIVLSAVVFAIQATAVTPLSVSTASQHVENQERALAETTLEQAAHNGTLRDAVLYWHAGNRTFVNATAEGYVGRTPDTPFGRQLERLFGDSQIAINVYVGFMTNSGPDPLGQKRMVYQGQPSDNAVSAAYSLTLLDTANLTGPYSKNTLNASNATSAFYAPDVAPNSTVYNVVEVRIVAWRM